MIQNPVLIGSGKSPVLQEKSVAPSESEQNVTPDIGYDGLNKVTVGAIQTESKTVTANGTVTPSSGKYLKQVTVNVPASGIDTSDATATASDMAEGVTAYVGGKKVTGSLTSVNGFNFSSAVASWDSQNSKLMLSGTNPIRCIVSANGTSKMYCTGDKLGDASAADVAEGKTFTSSAGLKVTGTAKSSAPTLQEKSVAPAESAQSVTPDSGYDGLSKVTVGAIQTESKTVTANGTVTPSSGKYLKQVTVNVPASGIDTSDATATADDIAKDKTAYVGGEKVTGTVSEIGSSSRSILATSNMVLETVNSKKYIKFGDITRFADMLFRKTSELYVRVEAASFGNATAADVADGKTFTSSAGLTVKGTAKASVPTLQAKTVTPSAAEQTVTPDSGYDGLSSVTVEAMPTAALSTPTISVDSAGKITAKVEQAAAGYVEAGSKSATKQLTTKGAATITPGTSDQTIASGTYLTGAQTVKGDANLVAGNIKSGVSIFGVAGSFEGSGGSGGSSDNNCEAYHITSASAVLSFKGTGTVKVWGYGSKKSNYTTTVYAFVGDGYYAGSSYGTPSKTSATFSIASDGTLSGLPSGLSAIDLLVTVGV